MEAPSSGTPPRTTAAATPVPPPPPAPWSRHPPVLAGTGAGLVAFGVLLGVLVVRYTGPAPPDPMADMLGMAGGAAMPGLPSTEGSSARPRGGRHPSPASSPLSTVRRTGRAGHAGDPRPLACSAI